MPQKSIVQWFHRWVSGEELACCADPLLVFNDGDEVLWWATEQIIHHNQGISKCAVCQSYFAGMNSMQKYCSTKCFQNNRAVGKFCGDEEIQKMYMAIYQFFRRK